MRIPGRERRLLLFDMEQQKEEEREEYKEIPEGDGRRFIFDTIKGVYYPVDK